MVLASQMGLHESHNPIKAKLEERICVMEIENFGLDTQRRKNLSWTNL